MDRNTIRERLLTGFRPREVDIATPYLGELDGELKLVGLSGKERIILEQQATSQITEKDGTTSSKLDRQKFLALATAACLRLRSTGEKVLNVADVIGESGGGDGAIFEMDSGAVQALINEVATLIGSRPAKEIKNDSKPTGDGSDTTSSPPDSDEPSKNSSTPSTPEN